MNKKVIVLIGLILIIGFTIATPNLGENKLVKSTSYEGGEKIVFIPNDFDDWSIIKKVYYLKAQSKQVNN